MAYRYANLAWMALNRMFPATGPFAVLGLPRQSSYSWNAELCASLLLGSRGQSARLGRGAVEGVWQGLKSLDNGTDERLFHQPDTLGPKPISHAALLVDYLNGKLRPFEDAHQRMLCFWRNLSILVSVSAN